MKETTERSGARKRGSVKVDWISSLPDELLILVLSFLTTKEAVHTCILSKRWRRVWVSLPILTFNVNEFRLDDSIGGSDEALRKSIASFQQFVSGVVKHLESTQLDRVHYVHDNNTNPAYFYKVPMQWLDRVALLMPRLIEISIISVKSLELPDSLFSCATLQHLTIRLHPIEKTTVQPASINLPSLKVFRLVGIELHDNFVQNLLLGCPSLEKLTIYNCPSYFSSISSSTLKELYITDSHQYKPIQVSCPSLFLFTFYNYLYGGATISLKNMKSLKSATIGLLRVRGDGDVPVLNIFGGLSNATRLRLLIESPELKVPLERDILNCRNLKNMKDLSIGMFGVSFDFNLLASFLKLFPNVEKLALGIDMSRIAIHEEHGQEVLGDVSFQHKYIELVIIRDWHRRELPEDLMKTFRKTLNSYVKEVGNIIME